MRPAPLMNLKQGINRLRVKGGANPSSLYDLVNGWIQADGSITCREGTIRAASLPGTKGLMADDGVFNVFSNTLVAVPAGYTDNVLVDPNDATQAVSIIWFAKPFMGFPYVVAQFANGDVFHYWLQNSGTWAANTMYKSSDLILPTVPTGFAYLAQRVSAVNPPWEPEVGITLNSIIEPTDYTGFQYKAVAVAGATPHTGSSEPVWPTVAAGTVQEFGDFDTSSTDAGTTQDTTSTAQPLSTTITDRYGDSSTIANAGVSNSGLTLPVTASTKVTTWVKGTLYAPGAVVKPSVNQGGFLNAIPNGDFEAGNDGNWVISGGVTFHGPANCYQGNVCLQFTASHSDETAVMNTFGTVTPGQSVTASCYVNPNNSGANLSMGIGLNWYTSGDVFISTTAGPREENGGYRLTKVTGTAPPTAARVRVRIDGGNNTSARTGFADLASWTLATPAAVSNFLFEAVQTTAGVSGTTEPVWPTIAGNTVVDNTVTWKAIGTSIITWEAIPIMLSGAVEPTWPTAVPVAVHDTSSFTDVNGAVVDTSISWITSSRQITDTKNPQSIAVALGASHVFAGDKDIAPFSAAVDPTDWSSPDNAGYLPTGLNNYGDNPVAVLALYRSNLMVINAGGYQMWQIDPDPANMALLDAQPIGSIYTRAWQSVANDLLGLTEVGVRNIGIAGSTANMQVGDLGQPIDPIVVSQLTGIPIFKPAQVGPVIPNSLISLLLHFDGTNGQTTVQDYSIYQNPVTVNGSGQIVTSAPKFGTGSLNGGGSAADGCSVPISPGGVLDLSTGDFTVECWIYTYAVTGYTQPILSANDGAGHGIQMSIAHASPTLMQFGVGFASGGIAFGATFVSPNTWYHVAMVRKGNVYDCWLNGQPSGGAVTQAGSIGTDTTFAVRHGLPFGAGFDGQIDELRVCKKAIYTPGVAFVPATAAFSNPQIVYTPISLYYPGRGQYWLFFGPQALVFTINGKGLRTWSRFIFPDTITDWTLNEGILYLRSAGDLVWQFDENTLVDDFDAGGGVGGNNVVFNGVIQWPFCDLGTLGYGKAMVGVDLVGTGNVIVQIAWDQTDLTGFNDNPNFATCQSVTPQYPLSLIDTVPGGPLPFPMTAPSYSLILTFPGNQAWEFQAANMYVNDTSGAGTTG